MKNPRRVAEELETKRRVPGGRPVDNLVEDVYTWTQNIEHETEIMGVWPLVVLRRKEVRACARLLEVI